MIDYKFHMAVEEWENAIGLIDRLIGCENVDKAQLYYDRGYCYNRLEQLEDALIDFSAYTALRPGSINGLKFRIEVLRELGRFEEVIADHDRIIDIVNNSGSRYDKLITLIWMEYWEQAVVESSLCIGLYPRDRRFYFARGEAFEGMKNFAQAICDYTKAWSMRKKDPTGILKRALVKEHMGDTEGALLDYDMAAGIPRNSYYGTINKARLLMQSGRFLEGIIAATPAIRKFRLGDDYALRGRCYFELCRFKEAEADLCMAVKKVPGNIDYRFNLAVCRYYTKKYPLALEDIKYVIEQSPGYNLAENLREDIIYKMSRLEK